MVLSYSIGLRDLPYVKLIHYHFRYRSHFIIWRRVWFSWTELLLLYICVYIIYCFCYFGKLFLFIAVILGVRQCLQRIEDASCKCLTLGIELRMYTIYAELQRTISIIWIGHATLQSNQLWQCCIECIMVNAVSSFRLNWFLELILAWMKAWCFVIFEDNNVELLTNANIYTDWITHKRF